MAAGVSKIIVGQEKFKIDDPTIVQEITGPEQPFENRTDKLVGTILDHKIQIESLIGQGGMSMVYKGTHLVLNRPVAVKIILPGLGFNDKAVLRLQQEAKAAFSLSHKNLASVHDVALTTDGLPYLVMDFAPGETLSEVLKRGPLDPGAAIEIFSQITSGLAAAHAQGVIHRDIKPGNIMVEQLEGGGQLVKVVDFGIAKKVTENAEEIQKLTQTGEVFGTPLYMSPEQCRGGKLDERSDIYSLGCVLYEALTGSPPFKGDSSIATIMMHLEKDAPTPDKKFQLPQPLISVLHRCLEKGCDDRYQTMGDLYKDLQAIKDGGATTKRYVQKSKIRKSTRRTVVVAVASFLVMVVCVYSPMHNQTNNDHTAHNTSQTGSILVATSPDDAEAYFARARQLSKQGLYNEAIAEYTKSIKLSKKPAVALAYRAEAYRQQKKDKDKEAVADCNSALALEPGNTKALYNRAISARHLGQYDQSLADCNAFLKNQPTNANILLTRARVFIALGRFKDAINDCTKGINEGTKLDNDGPTAKKSDDYKADFLAERASAYNYLGDSQSAVADASEAIKTNDDDPYGYMARAHALGKLHQFDKALEDVDKANELKPKWLQVKIIKAQILAGMGKLDKALALCNKVIATGVHSAPLLQLRATIYQQIGKTELARKDLEQAEAYNMHSHGPQSTKDHEGHAGIPSWTGFENPGV